MQEVKIPNNQINTKLKNLFSDKNLEIFVILFFS